MQETWVQSLGQKTPLEKERATHSQYACLENSMDRGVWQATVHLVRGVRHDLATVLLLLSSNVACLVILKAWKI